MNEPESIHPWSTIWRDPRGTIRQIVEVNPNHSLILLAVFGGLGNALNYCSSFGLGSEMELSEIFALCILIGPLSGFLSIFMWSWLLGFSTRFLGGIASKQELRAGVAWSWAPIVYLLPLWGVKYILFQDELFRLEKPYMEAHAFLSGINGLFGMVDFLVAIASLFILFNVIAEVAGLSIWKSIGAFAVVMLALSVPAFLLLQSVAPMQ
jgi:hypothetical protein